MTSAGFPRRAWQALLLAALLTLSIAPLARAADPVPITTGAGADWGVKASFRSYIAGPIARGAIEVGAPATRNADGTFHWPVVGGEYDPETRSAVVRFGGSVRFTGHDGQLDMRVSNPRVEITPDGAGLYAEVLSRPNIEGAPAVAYPNARLAALDPSGIEPEVAGGTTTWPALPATLTPEGVAPFAGFYAAGTALDAIAFGYDGPGGTPIAEQWTAPGTDTLGALSSGTIAGGVGSLALGWDGLLLSSNYDARTVSTIDGATLAPLRSVELGFNPRNVAADRTRRAAYAVDTGIARVTEQAGALVADPAPLATFSGIASNELAVREADGAVFTIFGRALHRYLDGAHTSWSFETLGTPWYTRVVAGADGRLYLAGGGVAVVTFDGSGEAAVTPVVSGPASNVAVAADGTIAWLELNTDAWPTVVKTLHLLRPSAGGGYADPVDVDGAALSDYVMALSPDGERLFITDTTNTKVQIVEDGKIARTIDGGADALVNAIVPRADGSAYVSWRDGTLKLVGAARSPTPTTQPRDASVELPAAGATAEVAFTAAAGGSPAPTISWQQRPLGSSRWATVPGATGETLTVTASEALAGARYRAIFANAGGAIASEVATLSVTVKPRVVDPEPGGGGTTTPPPGGGGGTTPPPAGRPAPRATAPRLTAPRRATLGRGRTAAVATVACAKGAACTLSAPKRVVARIGGKRFAVAVIAPRRIAAGRKAVVRVRLTKAAARRLAGRRVALRLRLTAASGGAKSTRTVTVTLRGGARSGATR